MGSSLCSVCGPRAALAGADGARFADLLGAGVFSQNASRCMRVSGAIQAGTVWVNTYVVVSNAVPFGGFKASGIGRELGVDAIKEYTQVKSIHWNYGEMLDWPISGE